MTLRDGSCVAQIGRKSTLPFSLVDKLQGTNFLCHSSSHTDVPTLQKGKKAGQSVLQHQVSCTKQIKVRTQVSRADDMAQQVKELATKPENMSSILGSA